MAGQGTVAVELLHQLPQGVDAIIVPVGGGGLIGGIAAVMKAWRPEVQVIMMQQNAGWGRGCAGSWCLTRGAEGQELGGARSS